MGAESDVRVFDRDMSVGNKYMYIIEKITVSPHL
jgi:hypothetical protein